MSESAASTPVPVPAPKAGDPWWPWRNIALAGSLFVLAITALSVYDIVRSYHESVAETGRDLQSQARVIAEQAASSLQAVDGVLRQISEDSRRGAPGRMSPADLHAYLKNQALGLVQADALSLFDADGRLVASSATPEPTPPPVNLGDDPAFRAVRAHNGNGPLVAPARLGRVLTQGWFLPMARRLETADGRFAGGVAANVRVDYFQNFYRDVRPEQGTAISLVHADGTLVARHPAAEGSLGQRHAGFDLLLPAWQADATAVARATSPLDGLEYFGVREPVAGHPLAVVLTRETSQALAAWRERSIGNGLRTLALVLLAVALLSMLRWQLLRLSRMRASLEHSRERFALAAAGSEEGIWDWDVTTDTVYASPRAREIFGAGPGPETQPRASWHKQLQLHPDDAPKRLQAMEEHMAGRAPVYAMEYRVRREVPADLSARTPAGGPVTVIKTAADGDPWRWVRVRGLCVRDAQGRPLRMAGSVTDIDARRRAEDALRLSEERYALAMAGLTGGHWVWEVTTDALFVSPSIHRLFGLPENTPVTTRLDYFSRITVHRDDLRELARIEDDVVQGRVQRMDFEYRIVPAGSDRPRWILTRAQAFPGAQGRPLRMAGVSVDVTDRKETEQALRLSEERFALAVAGSNDGILDWDLVNDRMYSSERAMRMLGVDSTVTTRTRAEWMALIDIHPDDRQRHADDLRLHLEGGSDIRDGEYRVRAPGGGWRWLRVRMICVRDAEGRATRLAGSVTDIDPYKRVEAALRESEERYAFAMSGSNEGHWVWDFHSQQIYVSARLAQLFGLGEEARVMPAQAYFDGLPLHPDDRERVLRNRSEHVAGLTPRLDHEFRVLLPGSAAPRWLHTRAQCFRDAEGRPLRLAGATVDITDRKRAEEALRESEQRFTIAVAGADDGIWDFDYVNNRVFGSRRAREILGLRFEPEVQTFEEWFEDVKMHPEDAAERLRAMQEHIDGHTPAYEGEWRVLQPGGGHRWVRVRGVCVRDAEGRPLRMAGSVSDIDARKRAEESLRRSEERYALAVAGSDDGVWDWDFDAGVAFESARARQLQGLPPGPEVQPVEELVRSLRVHPEDAQRRAEGIRAHLAGETPAYECDYRVLHDDGEYRWIHVRALCIRDATGRPYRMAGSVTDIDARKRAEEARRASEERFALAVAGSKDGILDWDVLNDRMYVSEQALQIVGLDAATPIATQGDWAAALMPRLHEDDAAKLADELRAYPDSQPPLHEGEYRVREAGDGGGGGSGGGWRWIRFRGMSIRDAAGRPVRWAGSLSDIDAQKKAEEALRRSDERYQLAVAGSDQGLWDWDLESDSLFLSPRAQQLLWLEPGAPQRPRREWIALTPYHPDDIGPVRQALAAYLRGGVRSFKVEYRVRHHSGTWHWYRQRGIAVRDEQGRPTRMAGSIEDITDRKNADAERDRLELQLRQAQKLEAIGTLAGGIAHDFNNILAAILGYGEMAVKDAPEGSSQRRHIEAAVSAGMRAKSLVERILAFSRSGVGERIPVHVQSVVGEAIDQLHASLPGGITVERRLACGDSAVLGDPTQVHQVVMNLCANAVQAMRSQGLLEVTLDRVHELEPDCMTGPLAEGDYVRLRVRDTGCGISPQVLERIFDPFFTTKEVGVGTGLGLSLVHGIVTDLGGGINVVSELGTGSTFTVFLPWQSCVAPPVKEAPHVPEGHGETVLLVDDEEALVRLGEEMIAELGYEPVGFTSSRAALEAFRASPERFDAVLSDESMPEMTGSELARAIRAVREDIPIVLMTGYVTPGLNQRARDTGVAEVLAKPLVARDIARSLAGALRNGG